jgi:hypothetical protein
MGSTKLLFAALLVAGCNHAPVAPLPSGCETELVVPQRSALSLDVLFVIDNSPSMAGMQTDLAQRLPSLVERLVAVGSRVPALSLHVGVVTSDYGAGSTGAKGCQPSPGGQQGRMQAVGSAAPASCKPPVGAYYLSFTWDQHGKLTTNAPSGQDPLATFSCMAAVGSDGCAFEHTLESAYAAMHNNLPENAGFVQPGLLVIVFVTNRDDSSAPTDSDVFDEAATQYGHEGSYRSALYGIECGNPPMPLSYDASGGPLMGCVGAPNPDGSGPGKLYDVERYIDFFGFPASRGGVKSSPNDVLLVGIDGPETPFEVDVARDDCVPGAPSCALCDPKTWRTDPHCAPALAQSCASASHPDLRAVPAVRLNQVIKSAANHSIKSLCDDDWTAVLDPIGQISNGDLAAGCLPAPLPDPAKPDCVVEDVTFNMDGSTTVDELPRCGTSGGGFPCWRFDKLDVCQTNSPQSLGLIIDRNGALAPPHTQAHVYCAITC